ncbi:MAG: phosphonopyruvate decarboxylase [Muribaculum sp.]|nr:phosphonopyruvate decarboxylase [Muribaculum sp.]
MTDGRMEDLKAEEFVRILNADFYTGVPDSQLRALCDYLMQLYGTDPMHHIIAANEGNCAAIAAGYYLATGKVPVVYMQNSGEGNIINPAASLLNDRVYAIPVIFVIGWRGEPGVHDEPQHIYQGEVTVKLLEDMGIASFIVGKDTTPEELAAKKAELDRLLAVGKDVAFVIRKGALSYEGSVQYENNHTMLREEVVRHIVKVSGDSPVVSTTGKVSRELFEVREADGAGHRYDFLTVGSMGHSSSIALGIALQRQDKTVWCIDGDGAALMHMGAMAVIGSVRPVNLIHVVINNGAHETVGGMPTVARDLELAEVARACGYPYAVSVDNYTDLDMELERSRERGCLCMIEVKCALGAREDLGRPTTTALENRNAFMEYLEKTIINVKSTGIVDDMH